MGVEIERDPITFIPENNAQTAKLRIDATEADRVTRINRRT